MKPPKDAKIFLEGIEVGETSFATVDRASNGMTMKLKFKPNWVGAWKLQALVADERP